MNNEQFRRLVGATPSGSGAQEQGNGTPSLPIGGASAALGSRQRASIPMTPRSVGGGRAEFARQLAARAQALQPKKTFKTSAPKGSRMAEGYVDRAKARQVEEDALADERLARIKALEEQLKNEEIDQATFEKQMEQIAGGDLSSTHLVKGLDRKLLERIRKGENVYDGAGENKEEEEEDSDPDLDDELDRLEEKDVQAILKEKSEKKKGQLAPVALAPGKKRTRDQIIAEMKAARAAAKAAQESGLGNRFKKINVNQRAGTRIERDSKGREVMIIVDEDGHEKRKVRKIQPEEETQRQREQMMPDKNAKPLGMEIPEMYRKQKKEVEEEDDDIFAGAGDDYDPLAGMSSSSGSDDDEEEEEEETADKKASRADKGRTSSNEAQDAKSPPAKAGQSRNYFQGAKSELLSAQSRQAPPTMSDPAIQAAFKRAAQLGAQSKDGDEEDEEEDPELRKKRDERRRQMLESSRRDEEDLDMGFGTSRFEDEDDFDNSKVRLSEWGDEDDGDGGKQGKSKRKRGPKKRKGDANSAADVMRVVEERKNKS